MAYDIVLADRIRVYLSQFPGLEIEEKEMFGGLAFLVNGKMCVNVSGENMMCRFDPALTQKLAESTGFLPMIMKGKQYNGYCYVEPAAIKTKKSLEYWIDICLDFNGRAKRSKR